MTPDPSIPEPPPDAETTVTRRAWEVPDANGGPPTTVEQIVTTASWTTSTTFTTEDGEEIPVDQLPAEWLEAAEAATRDAALALSMPATPASELAPDGASAAATLTSAPLPLRDQDERDLPGVPRARRSRLATWLQRRRGR